RRGGDPVENGGQNSRGLLRLEGDQVGDENIDGGTKVVGDVHGRPRRPEREGSVNAFGYRFLTTLLTRPHPPTPLSRSPLSLVPRERGLRERGEQALPSLPSPPLPTVSSPEARGRGRLGRGGLGGEVCGGSWPESVTK